MKHLLYKSKRALFALVILAFNLSFAAENEKKFEINPAVSLYTADTLRATFAGALQVDYRINRTYWFGVSGFFGKAAIDTGTTVNAKDGDAWYGVEGNFYYNMVGILGEDKETGSVIDLFTSIGLGYFQIGDEREPVGMIGGGMLIHFPVSWVALRFDLKNYMYVLQNPQGNDFNSDLTLLLGPAFLF